jgi:hypothetical protein
MMICASCDGGSWFCFEEVFLRLCPAPTWNVRAIITKSAKAD